MNKLTKTLISSVVVSVALVFSLMAIIYSATTGTGSTARWILQFLLLLILTAAVIAWWMRYLRDYVDCVIKREPKGTDKHEPN